MVENRLTKSKDKKVFGVCGGVAEYFGIDPTLVRLVWALAILVWGAGLWLYIILAIVMPDSDKEAGSTRINESDDDIVVSVLDEDEAEEPEKK